MRNIEISSDFKNNDNNSNIKEENLNQEFDCDSLLMNDESKHVLHDLLENSFNEENKNNNQFDLDKFQTHDIINKITMMINKSSKLIGEENFKKIYGFYKNLQEVLNYNSFKFNK